MIRPAQAKDASEIAEITNQIIRDTTVTFTSLERSSEAIAASIAASECFLVADRDGALVGFASFGPFRAGDGYASTKEHSIYVHENARGTGIGATLLAALEKEAKAQNISALVAGISGENPSAIAFHTRAGFQQVGLLPGVGHKFGRALDLVLMQKTL